MAGAGRPAAGGGRPTWTVPILVAIAATILIAVMARSDATDAGTARVPLPGGGSAGPGLHLARPNPPPVIVASSDTVSNLKSRFLGRATIEIWGRTTAPDGSSITLRIKARGGPAASLPDAPAVRGRFYAMARVPPELQGRPVDVSAVVSAH